MLIQYKCPNCGADMGFDSTSGTLSCGSCGRQDNIEEFSDDYITKEFSEDEAKEYNCENCGANIITDADTTATMCSFCGSGVVLADRLTGVLAPAEVIPFTISKDEARAAFQKWCKKGLLTPNKFMEANRIKGITGLYVPFWLYDINSRAKVHASGTKVRTYTSGDYIYTETKYYDIIRDIDLHYSRVPTDASEKMNDEIMDKLEPYQYRNLKDFKTPYLAGYIAEKYNFDDKELFPRVQQKVQPYIESYISSTITGFQSVRYHDKHIDTRSKKASYTLLPVWMFYYDYEKSEHTFAMNGQTGKVVGKAPISKAKAFGWFAKVAGATFITLKLFSLAVGGGL